MTRKSLLATKSPNDSLALSNCAIVHPNEYDSSVKYVMIRRDGMDFIFSIKADKGVASGMIGFSHRQRRWVGLSLNEEIVVDVYDPSYDGEDVYLGGLKLEVDFLSKSRAVEDKFDTTEMSNRFVHNFKDQVMTVGQLVVLEFKGHNLGVKVLEVNAINISEITGKAGGDGNKEFSSSGGKLRGMLMQQTEVIFSRAEGSLMNLVGAAKGAHKANIINPDWNFERMGIGGLDSEFSNIFRRAFASRIFPPNIVEKLGINHVKGILLFGPPGTGKTLMARQIGKMLNGAEPKIVNGPEVLNKYVGQSEENIRNLFKDAEMEYKAKGENSSLHIVIFDEIDAICKQRGMNAGSTGVGDTVVNQLLSKIDGVDQLNNILLIGMTNRRDLIDEALLRPGRLEVQMEIGLPDVKGRLQILKIHTTKMRENDLMNEDVSLDELSELTKNFSGAEIEGLIKSATSFAFNRHVKATNMAEVDNNLEEMKITKDDFLMSLEEVKPAFGVAQEAFENCIMNGIITWSRSIQRLLDDGQLYIRQVANSERTPLVTVLVEGPASSGKTALAAKIAMSADFPYMKMISPNNLLGHGEQSKCNYITKVFDDAYKSALSVIVIDDIERLLEYVPIGPRFSNTVLQTILVLMKRVPPKGRRLLIVGTTSSKRVLEEMGALDAFDGHLLVPTISSAEELIKVIEHIDLFDEAQLAEISKTIKREEIRIWVGVKKLLMMAEMARQDMTDKVMKFLQILRDDAGIV
eukprot:Nk52_evm9s2438 gene=Nk52_evmTU9s2438